MSQATALADLAHYASVPLPQRPLLVPWVRPVEIGDDLLELRAAETFYPLRHPLLVTAFRAIEGRLDGKHELGQISADLPTNLEPAAVVFLLKMLRAIGLLLDGNDLDAPSGPARDRLLFLSAFTPEPANIERQLTVAKVHITGPEHLARRLTRQLRSAGCDHVTELQVSELSEGRGADLLIACADAPARDYFSRVNTFALQRQQPWLRVAAHGGHAWLGPLVLPGESACFACLEVREAANIRGSASRPQLEPGAMGAFAPQEDLLAAQAATEAARFLGRFAPPATVGNVYELSVTSPSTHRHALLRVPGCHVCGDPWITGDP